MHSYTVNDVLAEGFNLSLLSVDDAELSRIKININNLRAKLESDKRAAAIKSGQNSNYIYLNDSEVLQAQTILTDKHYLSMVFSEALTAKISAIIYGDSAGARLWVSWVMSSAVNRFITLNPSLAKKALICPTTHVSVKHHIVNQSIIQTDELISFLGKETLNNFPEHIQMRVLEISNPEDCDKFLSSDYDKVKLAAYKKLGPLKHLDKMVSDPHAVIRSYAISILSPGDKLLAKFINDRSQYIFCEALQKISSEHIPMMLGSSHLKKKRAKEILNQRLAG